MDTPNTSTLLMVYCTVDGYTLHVNTAGGEERYTHTHILHFFTLHVQKNIAGGGQGYTIYVHSTGGNGRQPASKREIPKCRDNSYSDIGLFL
jgi:hypothetical protein